METLKSLLAKNDLKSTPQRIAILDIIRKKGHASVEEIYESIKVIFPTISLATIYKNINLLKEKNIITEINLRGNLSKYEIIKSSHGHFICEKCKEVFDFDVEKVCSPSHTDISSINSSDVYLYGICKKCQSTIKG